MADSIPATVSRDDILHMTTEVVSAYVCHNPVSTGQMAEVIETVYGTLNGLASGALAAAEPLVPAISVRSSIRPDFIVCLEDGKKLKMLKRHLRTAYGMTPEEYRTKWGLPSDYPMVAPNYAALRSQFAKNIGLGRKGKA